MLLAKQSNFSPINDQKAKKYWTVLTIHCFGDDKFGISYDRRFCRYYVFQDKKGGCNLIGALQLISMLTALPINKQVYLFSNMMLNKN